MFESANVHLVLMPPDKMDPDLVNEIGAIFKKDAYQTRQILSGKIPKLIASYHSPEEAETVAGSIKAIGLWAITCDNSFLLGPPGPIFGAVTLRTDGDKIVFLDTNGAARILSSGDVFLVVKGVKQTRMEAESTKTSRKLSVGKTILTGGIPMFDKVIQKATVTSTQNALFLRLYGLLSPTPLIELIQNNIDYKFLGTKLNYSSMINFNNMANDIKNYFPGAVFDDRLTLVTNYKESSTTKSDLETNCRLLYLYHKTVRKR